MLGMTYDEAWRLIGRQKQPPRKGPVFSFRGHHVVVRGVGGPDEPGQVVEVALDVDEVVACDKAHEAVLQKYGPPTSQATRKAEDIPVWMAWGRGEAIAPGTVDCVSSGGLLDPAPACDDYQVLLVHFRAVKRNECKYDVLLRGGNVTAVRRKASEEKTKQQKEERRRRVESRTPRL